jgi:eukaryotic-like serine/threonine-protein kinase
MSLQPGETLDRGKYRIVRLIGSGGFGSVYLAQDTLLREEVAIKELEPGLDGDQAALSRFLAEAKATMRLRHERIVGTHSVFTEAGHYYIVMEYLAGDSLEARLKARGALPPDESVRIAAEVCEGLAYAHERGVVHCDLKPANVLFTADGHAKVADFGIAHIPTESLTRSWATPAGFVAGTVPYMSPEQADGVRDDPRVDVYAVGAVLYRMLTGRPYLDFDTRETPAAQARNVGRIQAELPVPPGTHNRRMPAWLDAVVLKALAKRPEERYSNAVTMGEALVRREAPQVAGSRAGLPAAETVLISPLAGSAPPTARARRGGLPAWFWMGVVVAAALLTLIVILVTSLGNQGESPWPLAKPALGSTMTSKKDGTTRVYVPAGAFLMGSTDADRMAADDEKPSHTVYLDAFWIDRTEVTNAMYAKCVLAGVCQPPRSLSSRRRVKYYGNQQYDNYPVINVTWSDALAYCAWADGRLPTEAEWEKAARGADGRMFVWGNQSPDAQKANYVDSGMGDTASVGAYLQGASPYGALDMAGNVMEWVADLYGETYYASSPTRNPQGPASSHFRVVRGGSYESPLRYLRVAARDYRSSADVYDYWGFRCASSS